MAKLKKPHMVFKCPGKMAVHEGVSYDWLIVDTEEVPAHVKLGWHASIVGAKAAAIAVEPEPDEPDDDAPPTREELEAQAKKLGIKVDGRYSDRRLMALIAEKMG